MGAVFLFLLFPVLIGAFLLFDAIVRIEYERYREAWVEDGKPYGFFWIPVESRGFGGLFPSMGGSLARMACIFSWAFATPEWLEGEPKGRRALFWFRVLLLVWHMGVVTALCIEYSSSK